VFSDSAILIEKVVPAVLQVRARLPVPAAADLPQTVDFMRRTWLRPEV
jgi:hypothetical protein